MTLRRLKSVARFLPLVLLAVVLWREKPWTIGVWGQVPYAMLVTVVLNFAVFLPMKAARWRVALNNPPPFRHVFAVTIEGLLANAAIGLGSGDLVRAARLRREQPQLAIDYASTWAEHGAEALALLILILVASRFVQLGTAVTVCTLLGMLIYGLLLLLGKRFVPCLKVYPRLQRALDSALCASTPRRVTLMMLLSLAGWASELLMLSAFFWAFRVPVEFHTVLLTLVGINAAIVIPAIPGNFGTFEAGATVAMVLCGVPRETAVMLALTYHLTHVIPVVIVATTVFLIRSRRTHSKETPHA
jgi:uncharacterized membrane protein YbhN (UPF0104 family)